MPFRLRTAVSGAMLATAAVLLCPAAAAARPAAAPAAPGWSAAPAPGAGAAPGAPDRPFFYLEGAPGTVLADRLSLSNPTGRTVAVRLRGSGSGAGAWLTLASKEVRIPPHTRAGVPFTVTVPRDAAPGDRSGTLFATGVGKGTGAGRRATVPLHLRVTGPVLFALTVEKVSVRRAGGAALIRYTLVNRGTTALRPRIGVRADGLFGPLLRRAARTQPSALAPGRALDLVLAAPLPLLAAGAGGLLVLRRRRRGAGPGGRRGEESAPGPGGGTRPSGDEPADTAGVLAGAGPGARA
ncbi:hypothetical protein OIU81_22275 [Streptomyces sp. NBC_01454]|uniref:COG1470 family protein n=1 Tax=Streptomyces sp. NBC_01454 TaxID=2975867 RepID=UPI002E33B0E1|nr:hypothetical protein [Streptomyces sp. NBC_01454]